jgi:hypothetical protein
MYIPIYIQHDTTFHSLFYPETALYVSGGTTTHHQERKQLYLQHLLFVRPLLLPAALAAGSSNGLTNTRYCRYSCLRSWWWVVVLIETCRAVSIQYKLCNVASCRTYIRIFLRCTDPWMLYLYIYSFCVLNFTLTACRPNFDEDAHWPDLEGNAMYVQRKCPHKINYSKSRCLCGRHDNFRNYEMRHMA